MHGQVDTTPHGVVKTDHHYGHQQANLAHTHNPSQLTDGLAHILTAARPYLAADATVAITARPWRHRGTLIDLPALVLNAGQQAGLIPAERLVCLLAAMRGDGQLIPRSSFFQLHAVKTSRASGLPLHLIAHEDLLIFHNPSFPRSCHELKGSQHEPGSRAPAS